MENDTSSGLEEFLIFLADQSVLIVFLLILFGLVLVLRSSASSYAKAEAKRIELLLDLHKAGKLPENTSIDSLLEPSEPSIRKALGKIEWDIAGVIGLFVTLVILILVMVDGSKFSDYMPAEVMSAWAIIIGYYFGKQTNA